MYPCRQRKICFVKELEFTILIYDTLCKKLIFIMIKALVSFLLFALLISLFLIILKTTLKVNKNLKLTLQVLYIPYFYK